MKQQYFITVRTTGPYNANMSTRKLCSLITRKLHYTTVSSTADIEKVRDYVYFVCDSINLDNPRNKKLVAEGIWEVSSSRGSNGSRHFSVKIDGHSSGDGTFLIIDFAPVKHHYYGQSLLEDLYEVSNYVPHTRTTEVKNRKQWMPNIAQDGDIITDDWLDKDSSVIIIVKKVNDYSIIFHAVLNEYGILINESGIATYGSPHSVPYRFVTEEEKGVLINELYIRGLRWDEEKKEVVKLDK